MKAAIYKGNREFVISDASIKELSSNEVRIKVAYCGICGTDRHVFHGAMDERVNPPQIIGHEMSGTVTQIGENVSTVSVGDLVVVRPLDNRKEMPSDRGYSHICQNMQFIGLDSPGAMQQSWIVPDFTVHPLPKTINMQLAALVEPLAVACHDVSRAQLQVGECIVIIGGGPIGLLIAMVAKHKGAKVILLEINEFRLQMAESIGCTVINSQEKNVVDEVLSLTNGEGVDIVFEVSGSKYGAAYMTEMLAIRGRIVLVAIYGKPQEINLFRFFWKELTLLGARVYEPQDYDEAIALVAGTVLPLEKLITDVYPLSRIQEAFEILDSNPNNMKILLDCQNI